MSAEVVSLKGGEVTVERREAFVQAVAASFDLYVKEFGEEPDAIVYVLCGLKQNSWVAWDIHGESLGGSTSVLSLAAIHCQAEAAQSRRGV